jgi:hypothetical protein
VEGAEAAGADFDFFVLAVDFDGVLVDVGHEAGIGAPFGVGDVMAGDADFPAMFALHVDTLN